MLQYNFPPKKTLYPAKCVACQTSLSSFLDVWHVKTRTNVSKSRVLKVLSSLEEEEEEEEQQQQEQNEEEEEEEE